jgi:predicted PurR-regulated permease PerM
MRQVAGVALTVVATLTGVLVLWQFRGAMVLFVLSLALAATLRPLVEKLVARGWPRQGALLFVYGLSVVLFLVIVGVVGGAMLTEMGRAADQFVVDYDLIWARWPQGTELQQGLIHWLPPPAALYATASGPSGAAIAQGLFGVTSSLVEGLSRAAIVVVMSLYWGVDQAGFERLWSSWLPAIERARAREIWRDMEAGVGSYIRSELVQSLLAGLLLGVGYRIAGLPYPTLLAVVSAMLWLIPWLGAALGLGPVLLAGWAAGPVVAVIASLYTLLVFVILQFIVEPRLYDRRQYSSLLIAFLAIVLGQAYGVLGLLVAPPLAAALQILFGRLVTPGGIPATVDKAVDSRYSQLEKQFAALNGILNLAPDLPAPAMASLVRRLEGLLLAAGTELAEQGVLHDGSGRPNDSIGWPPEATASAATAVEKTRQI